MFSFSHVVMFTETINGSKFNNPKKVTLNCDEKTGIISWPSGKVYFTPQKADVANVIAACKKSAV